MQLFKYVTLTLWQQQYPDDEVLPPLGKQMKCCHLEVNKVTCQKGLLKKIRRKAKNMNLTQTFTWKSVSL